MQHSVTVAIACYNQAHFLPDAIESALAQTHPCDAIILVDDGSTDLTARMAQLYPQVSYHRQANGGLSAARNTGLALCRTSHILFLDADDLLMPDTVERGLRRFADWPDIAFAYGGYRDVAADRRPIGEREAVEHRDAYLALLHDNHISMHGTVLYAVAPLRAIGGFDTALPSCEDYDVYLKLTRQHAIAAYPGIGAEYRRHGQSMSTNAPRMIETVRKVIERQMAAGLTPEQQAAARAGIAFATRFYTLQMIAELKTALARPWAILAAGLRHDPRFMFRLIGAIGRAVTRKLGVGARMTDMR